jgi:glycosyltransferase involved in cell wall biosynthesis
MIRIVVSTYNRAEKLERLYNSLCTQQFQDWRLIVVDDGSSDSTPSLSFLTSDKRVEYIRFLENRGHPVALFEARAFVMRNDETAFIFIGSDDYFLDSTSLGKMWDKVSEQANSVWKTGFLWVGEGRISGESEPIKKNESISFQSHELFSDRYPNRDFLFVYGKHYIRAFQKYFTHPDKFFSSSYDVSMNNSYEEIHHQETVVVAGWASDNITKGQNHEKYFRWAHITREHLYSSYKTRMSLSWRIYSLRSLIVSNSTVYGHRSVALNYLMEAYGYLWTILKVVLIGMVLIFLPKKTVGWTKKTLFKLRRNR